jgi:hypothetical protein
MTSHLDSAASGEHPHAHARTRTDADVYAGIAHAWWSMHRVGEHHEHLIRTFMVNPGFAGEVWGRGDVDPDDVICACARIVALRDYEVERCATQTQAGKGLGESLDPVRSWWCPLESTPELGVHFWQLVLVPVELRCIGPADDPPPLLYGRFAECAARARLRAVPA